MRLLNTTTLEFKEFIGSQIPAYAILSHVWSSEEVSYDDYLAGRGKDGYGYEKIVKLCELAKDFNWVNDPGAAVRARARKGLEWAWIDTCCIDKRSSAELSEAINAMFRWYQNAAVCFVFLPDVDRLEPPPLQVRHSAASFLSKRKFVEFDTVEFVKSRWFTRGWTLQELLAPPSVLFFNTAFEITGARNGPAKDIPLSHLIAKATRIAENALYGVQPGKHCVAQKMSWAANRETTREEDLAYCLLGLFDVNMPLLYGEGASRAFLRLQSEIVGTSTDDSIFAWDVLPGNHLVNPDHPWSGLLAQNPRNFENCGDISIRDLFDPLGRGTATYTMTQRGTETSIHRNFYKRIGKRGFDRAEHPLRCARKGKPLFLILWIDNTPHFDGRYADGARLAWRSECVTREGYREALARQRRSVAENKLCEAMDIRALPTVSSMLGDYMSLSLEAFGLMKPKLIKVYFKTTWNPTESFEMDWDETPNRFIRT